MQNQIYPDAISMLHIVGGMYVIGRASHMGEEVHVHKPMQLLIFRGPDGRVVGGTMEAYGHLGMFRPFEAARFHNLHVLHIVTELPDNIEKQYLQATTGIQLAKA